MTPDQSCLEADRAAPRIAALWHALTALRSPVLFLQSGAHPDDETSEMLAALRFRDGLGIGYLCSTRGEGGQNDIGREAGAALGTLRTAEMERAAARLDMRLWWLPGGPDDSLRDFGFSKSGEETLRRWGRERTLALFARALRRARPDILCPTFLDVAGQHGHHRAMTALAPEAMARAADPLWDDGAGLAPWAVAKLYLPAWSGAGTAYDDETPPPPATVTVRGEGRDGVTGWAWARMGQHSRAMHRTQGMGRWPAGARDFPLHLVGGEAEDAVTDGLPAGLHDLDLARGAAAQEALEAAVAAFPDGAAVAAHAARALALLPEGPEGPDAHRVARKRRELMRVLWLASGAEARAATDGLWIGPDAPVSVTTGIHAGAAEAVAATLALPPGWAERDGALHVGPDVRPDPMPASWDPLDPPLPALAVRATVAGAAVALRLPLDRTAEVEPRGVRVDPAREVVNRAAGTTAAAIRLDPPDAALALPPGWRHADGAVHPGPEGGTVEIPVTRDGAPAPAVERVHAAHVPPRVLARPATLRLAVIDAALPDRRVGYVGAGRDRVGHWLRRIGLPAADLSDAALDDPARMAEIDTVVVGVFALRFREGLAERMPALHRWIRAGGTLVTLYHRPWDRWDPGRTPPLPLEIGQPSLRWRVTDAGAAVTHLAPDHPVLRGPNPIGPEDWGGWHKERGLYFARSWDPAYVPLLRMADPGEAPLDGALLSAEVGAGRHTHCALILHHQMEELVPGAFRLAANLCA